MNADQLAELEEERRFLLRSLADLEREHDVGDVDDVDYGELKDGYTVRAAATMRAIDDGRASLPGKPATSWKRRVIGVVVVVVSIGLVSWALVASSAERKPGEVATGLDPRSEQQQLIAQARALQLASPGEAAAIYAQVLQLDPDNTEVLTYFGWTLALDAEQRRAEMSQADVDTRLGQAIDVLTQANTIDPSYADPKCFLGILYFRSLGQPAEARPWVDQCLAANPPADVRGLVEALSEALDAELAGSTVTTTLAP